MKTAPKRGSDPEPMPSDNRAEGTSEIEQETGEQETAGEPCRPMRKVQLGAGFSRFLLFSCSTAPLLYENGPLWGPFS